MDIEAIVDDKIQSILLVIIKYIENKKIIFARYPIFWTTALSGVDKESCSVIVFVLFAGLHSNSRGYVKPRKHILLRISIKNLTGSKKVLNVQGVKKIS